MKTQTQRIEALLEEQGPLSSHELAELLGSTTRRVAARISELRKAARAHIKEWRRDADGGQLYYPRALYAAGPGVDAKKPRALTPLQYTQRYRERSKGLVSSVFTWGVPVRKRRVGNVLGKRKPMSQEAA